MRDFLYSIVRSVARIHNTIMKINDAYEYNFTDKELHFIVIGLLGMLMIFAIYPIFKALAAKGHILAITWIYVFTLILVITFAIEIGQKVTGTGRMEFADIVFGVVGFASMFAIFAILRGIVRGIIRLVKKKKRDKEK